MEEIDRGETVSSDELRAELDAMFKDVDRSRQTG